MHEEENVGGEIIKTIGEAIEEMGSSQGLLMLRGRPYQGQPHTASGERGKTEVKGVTFRDLMDCYIRAVMISGSHVVPDGKYEEAKKGEMADLCSNDLYGFDWDKLDPMAVFQQFSCEVERMMGIYPNVPGRRKRNEKETDN